MFRRLQIGGWRQFGDVDLTFHPRLTVLTGANASGKTTILNILGQHFSWRVNFLGTPQRDAGGQLEYISGLRDDRDGEAERAFGVLEYESGTVGQLLVEDKVATQFQVQISPREVIAGVVIPSHRSFYGYQPVMSIPSQFSTSQQILDSFIAELLRRYVGEYSNRTPMYSLKETLLAAGAWGPDTGFVHGNPEGEAIFHGFERVLSILMPPSLGFHRLRLEPPDVLIEAAKGVFPIDAASGGLTAMMEVAWQVFLRSRDSEGFTVCFDEPENHLHPELQRSVLPSLLDAFPAIQFIVATHNPLVVTSVPESNVYVFRYGEDGAVYSELLDQANKAGTSNDVLREVLGLEATVPLWVEKRLTDVVRRYSRRTVSEEMLNDLREELASLGMGDAFPATTAAILEREGLE